MADSDLDYCKIVGRIALAVGDGPDSGENPDLIFPDRGSTVTFEPLQKFVKVDGAVPPVTIGGANIVAHIDENTGYITYPEPTEETDGSLTYGDPRVWLLDLGSDKVNPVIARDKAAYRVTFNVRFNATKVDFPSFTFHPLPGVDNDITLMAPVPVAGGNAIVVGPRGTSIQALSVEGGDLIATFEDGTEVNAGKLPVGPGGSDAGVADYATTPGTQTRKALVKDFTTKPEIQQVRANPVYATQGCVVTFIDDDGDPLINQITRPLFNTKGIKGSFAVVGASVTGDAASSAAYPSLTVSQLKEIEAEGHDVLSHGWRHYQTSDAGVTTATLDADYAQMSAWMRENFPATADMHVYPGGLGPTLVSKKSIARKHFRYAVDTTTLNSHNSDPVDNWSVQRVNGDTLTEAQLKAKVDAAVAAKGWLIVMTHDKQLDTTGGGRAAQVAKIGNVIDYIKAQTNTQILKFSDAERIRGNAIALGEYSEFGSHFVSQTGKVKPNGAQGTWTPTLYGATVAGSHVYNQRKGHYQVFGGMVIVKGSISLAAGTAAVINATTPAQNIVTPGNLVLAVNGTQFTTTMVNGDTPTSMVTKLNTQYGAGFASLQSGVLRLTTLTLGPSVTLSVVSGTGSVLTDLGLTAGQSANGGGGVDGLMSGNLRVGGLPLLPTALDVAGIGMCTFNIFNLGAGYTTVSAQSGSADYLSLFRQGNNVAEAFLTGAQVVPSQTLNLRFVVTYMIPPSWTA